MTNYGRGLYAHENVVKWLQASSVSRDSVSYDVCGTGILGDLLALPVFSDPELEPGDWLIRNSDGDVTDFGRIRSLSTEKAL